MYNRYFALIILLFLASGNPATGSNVLSSHARLFLNEYHEQGNEQSAKQVSADFMERYGLRFVDGQLYTGAVLWVDASSFNPGELSSYNTEVRTQLEDLYTVWTPVASLDALATNVSGIRYIEAGKEFAPFLDDALVTNHADKVHAGEDLIMPYTGEGVIMGVTDNGFDYMNPVFRSRQDSSFRLISAWNQREDQGIPPNGYTYGMEVSSPEDFKRVRVDSSNSSHGTHVAGIAAGWGWGTSYNGVAPDSDLIFVRHGRDVGSRIDAFRYIRDIAREQGKPAVINKSWGNYQGPQDGTSLLSRAINHLTEPGLIFVSSAGNTGRVNFHVDHTFNGSEDTLKTVVGFDDPDLHSNYWGQSVTMWGDVEQDFTLNLLLLDGDQNVVDSLVTLNSQDNPSYYNRITTDSSEIELNIAGETMSPLNNKPNMMIRVRKDGLDHLYLALHATATEGTVHMWNLVERNNYSNRPTAFEAPFFNYSGGDSYYGIGEPACTESVVTVGAHRTAVLGGEPLSLRLAAFSSRGPTPDGRIKPEITAKGQEVASVINEYEDDQRNIIDSVHALGERGYFARLSGTSMSSPIVSGVVALMLQVYPELDFETTLDILTRTAIQDEFTDSLPPEGSVYWGHGKVNAWEALRQTEITSGTGHSPVNIARHGISVYPNPARNHTTIQTDPSARVHAIRMYDLNGREVSVSFRQTNTREYRIEWAQADPGLYMLQVEEEAETYREKLLLVK